MDINAQRSEVFRNNPRVKILGRLCFICKHNAPIALVLRFVGLVQGDHPVCVPCVKRELEVLFSGRDVEWRLTIEQSHGGILVP